MTIQNGPHHLIFSLRGKRSVPAEMSLGRNSPAGLLTESVTKTTFTETTVNNDDDVNENEPRTISEVQKFSMC